MIIKKGSRIYLASHKDNDILYKYPHQIKLDYPNIDEKHLRQLEKECNETNVIGFVKRRDFTEERPLFVRVIDGLDKIKFE